MSEYFIFGGIDTRNYSMMVFERNSFGGAVRSYESIVIPGRDGIVLMDNKRSGNIDISYDCIIYQNGAANLDSFRNAIMGKIGYQRLEDSIHPLEYYQAVILQDFTATLDRSRELAKFALTFSRKPQRYLKSGETSLRFSGSGSIYNPTANAASPLLTLSSSGTVNLGSYTITASGVSSTVTIDCETMEATPSSQNANIAFSSDSPPVLEPGSNGISTSGITVDVTPRWYNT